MNGYIHLKHLLSSRGTPKPYKALGTSCHTLSQDSFLIQTVLDHTEIPVSLGAVPRLPDYLCCSSSGRNSPNGA